VFKSLICSSSIRAKQTPPATSPTRFGFHNWRSSWREAAVHSQRARLCPVQPLVLGCLPTRGSRVATPAAVRRPTTAGQACRATLAAPRRSVSLPGSYLVRAGVGDLRTIAATPTSAATRRCHQRQQVCESQAYLPYLKMPGISAHYLADSCCEHCMGLLDRVMYIHCSSNFAMFSVAGLSPHCLAIIAGPALTTRGQRNERPSCVSCGRPGG
jgi:hypothetical protein